MRIYDRSYEVMHTPVSSSCVWTLQQRLVTNTNYEALLHSVFTNIMSLPPSVGKNIPLITLFNTASVCLCVSYSSYLWHATPYVLITH